MDEHEVVGSKGIVKKVELLRAIAEALHSLGYERSASLLQEEAGIRVYEPSVELLRKQIMDGKLENSLATLRELDSQYEGIGDLPFLVLFEHKFYKLIQDELFEKAMKFLRTEITPCILESEIAPHARIQHLCMILLNLRSFDQSSVMSGEILRDNLLKLFPSKLVVPKTILVRLLEFALSNQIKECKFHNTIRSDMSLFTFHQCQREQIPSTTIQTLSEHKDVIWCLQFSNNGKYLASSSRGCEVIIWEVEKSGSVSVSLKHRLVRHKKPVNCISWSSNDDHLLTCGFEEVIRRWETSTGKCLQVIGDHNHTMVSCIWSPNDSNIYSLGQNDDFGCLSMWDLQGNLIRYVHTRGTSELGISRNELITLFTKSGILFTVWDDTGVLSRRTLELDHPIVSFQVSKDGNFLLVTLSNQEIRLYRVDSLEKIASFLGHKRTRFSVKSCFGGAGDRFIASGSEDSQVYIWNRFLGLVSKLGGHSAVVSCVSWNPVDHCMLASGSIDQTIRIWG